MQQYGVHSLKEYLSLMTASSIPLFSTFINVVIAIAMIIGFIVIFQAMYAAVMERTREIGILKSLGAGKLYIVNVVLRETLLIAIGGIILGIVASYAAKAGLRTKFQTLPISDHRRLAGPCDGHRAHRLPAGRVLSGDQGRTKGPHRRAGVRIGPLQQEIFRQAIVGIAAMDYISHSPNRPWYQSSCQHLLFLGSSGNWAQQDLRVAA